MIPPIRWLRFRVNLARSLDEVDRLQGELMAFDGSDPEVEETQVTLADSRRWVSFGLRQSDWTRHNVRWVMKCC